MTDATTLEEDNEDEDLIGDLIGDQEVAQALFEEDEKQVNIDYRASPTLKRFHASDKFVRGLAGPIGCLAPETMIVTEEGLRRIDSLTHPMRVLSWDGRQGRFRFVVASGSFPKGTDALYRVLTKRGEWRGAGHHRVLCADGKWRQVKDLAQDQSLYQCSSSLYLTKPFYALLSLRQGVRHLKQTALNWKDHCESLFHQCGQRLHYWLKGDLTSQTSPDGAQIPDSVSSLEGCTHQDQPYDPLYNCDFPPHAAHRLNALTQRSSELYERTVQNSQAPRRSRSILGGLVSKLTQKVMTYVCSLSKGNIISITQDSCNTEYWDLQVPNTNNYVTADGNIHHNSGKSVGCCLEIIFRANRQKRAPDGIRYSRWVVIRNSYRELQDTTIKTWHDWFPEQMGEWREGTLTHTLTYNDVHLEVMFRALDRPEDVKKLLSLEVTGAWINEAREIPKAILDGVQGRVGRYPNKRKGGASWYGVIMDTNLMDVAHWWYRIFEEEKPKTWEVFKQPSGMSENAENIENLPDGYYDNLLVGHDAQWINVYVHGEYGFIMDGLPVQPNFHVEVHVADDFLEPVEGVPLYAGIDFGRTPAICFAQEINGQWRVLSEVVTQNMGASQFSKEVIRHINVHYRDYEFTEICGDPAGEQKAQTSEDTPFDILFNNGINATPCFTNDVTIRRETLGQLLLMNNMAGNPRLLVSPRCTTLVKGLAGGFKYKRLQVAGTERYQDVPDKGMYSHVCESLEYLLLGAGEDVSIIGPVSNEPIDYSSVDEGII